MGRVCVHACVRRERVEDGDFPKQEAGAHGFLTGEGVGQGDMTFFPNSFIEVNFIYHTIQPFQTVLPANGCEFTELCVSHHSQS